MLGQTVLGSNHSGSRLLRAFGHFGTYLDGNSFFFCKVNDMA